MMLQTFLNLLLVTNTTLVRAVSPLDLLARDVTNVESIRSIKNVQRQISHLAQFGQWHSISQLFTPNSTLVWANVTIQGASLIEQWLRAESEDMDGIKAGSLNTQIAENPLISLGADGCTAKGRWNGIWFQGDGMGNTRIQGGIYENEYTLNQAGWQISLLKYYAMYEGTYEDGWKNVAGNGIPLIPYHFSAASSGLQIPPMNEVASPYKGTMAQLAARIQRLNDEDDVRNLMHAHGYYVDRRMWTDVVDLHMVNTTIQLANGKEFTGKDGVRKVLERMGPEGLTKGINNDHPIFDMIVEVHANGKEATVRGIEIAMVGDTSTQAASWEFNVFRNRMVKEVGIWKVQHVQITPLIVADYYKGWGNGGSGVPNSYVPPFLNATTSLELSGPRNRVSSDLTVDGLQRRLRRSAAYDGSENQSHAYGYLLDDLQAAEMGALFAKKGHKASPFAGYFETPERITQANIASYGSNRSALRSSISFHWRPQPVILVSKDGRSATVRARLWQPSTSITKAGSFNSAMYHDQVVLEDGKWRLWSVTIDEFYWQSSSWTEGWANAKLRNSTAPNPGPAGWTKKYPPDITLADVGERESTFRGGSGRYIEWPEIQRMWFQYRNPVSGRMPEWYWPGCVPCQVREDWSLKSNGYDEPPTGP
ncbi:hypothetical protein DE146DRAFT_664880 [Phaeosphaeria sp. MPI-PUGE-AT-0046c]|nr:hypothetical protein DE146DRAFT_664880 [Phaeosphaeria sp. MPI-PUGE-AT-0046c]